METEKRKGRNKNAKVIGITKKLKGIKIIGNINIGKKEKQMKSIEKRENDEWNEGRNDDEKCSFIVSVLTFNSINDDDLKAKTTLTHTRIHTHKYHARTQNCNCNNK